MSSSVAAPSKDERRAQFRAYRGNLSDSTARARSALICHRALAAPALSGATTVHCYWPQSGTHEVDTRPLIAALRASGRSIVLPVVTSYEPGAPTMAHHRYEGRDALTPNRWGIPEPTDTPAVPPSALDLVIVPALGVGRNGHRIGHGAGYYDAFLAEVAAPRVVLSYEDCVVDAVPGEPHDIPATAIVTEHAIYDIPS